MFCQTDDNSEGAGGSAAAESMGAPLHATGSEGALMAVQTDSAATADNEKAESLSLATLLNPNSRGMSAFRVLYNLEVMSVCFILLVHDPLVVGLNVVCD